MQNDTPQPIIEIETTDEFDRRSKALTKKYRNLKTDLEPLIVALQSGETPGDILVGLDILALKVVHLLQLRDRRRHRRQPLFQRSLSRHTFPLSMMIPSLPG